MSSTWSNKIELLATLSDRERAVFERVVEGRSGDSIADVMFLSPKTVATYKGRIVKKLKLSTKGRTRNAAILDFYMDLTLACAESVQHVTGQQWMNGYRAAIEHIKDPKLAWAEELLSL